MTRLKKNRANQKHDFFEPSSLPLLVLLLKVPLESPGGCYVAYLTVRAGTVLTLDC